LFEVMFSRPATEGFFMQASKRPSIAGRPGNPLVPSLRVGFILLPRFTLTAFAGFVDALRLAADEGDRSRQLRCTWAVMGQKGELVESSCGVKVVTSHDFTALEDFDYIVVVGGVMHGGQKVPRAAVTFLRRAADAGLKIVGLCTGSFALARAGLLDGHLACVSWFHREDFLREFPKCKVVSDQMYVADRNRLTCAGGTSVVHLAAYIIERAVDRASAVRALRIMIERQPLPPRTLQPEPVLSETGRDTVVRKAMLLLEQNLAAPVRIMNLARTLQIGRRQLERRFLTDIGLTPTDYRQRLRMERARWLLENTDLQVAEIASECGFHSSAHFGRVIRQTFKCAPLQLRARRPSETPRHTARRIASIRRGKPAPRPRATE
jgi:transcriptional regulator GlxA family with amidase domain